ncbi:hypothetical protein MLD38_027948 [Melastoma candidum]|uniref:Uncharacterized protein n=1 Tax=Melastoma candidum TaxID=119954 RepID=A0ACB9MZG1_9MYRT|nr:hypothetical protein MLD38_027948 [Melastoma candidum]
MAMAGEVLSAGFPEELHVLAVDDSLVDRKVIEKLLKRLSCKVTAVDSARRALQFLGLDDGGEEAGKKGGADAFVDLQELKINLIMTDYSMPGMTGYELLKRIKESAAFREVPVVIMSSERVLPRINRCLEEGAEEFLSKPVQYDDVKRLRDFVIRGGGEACCDQTATGEKRPRFEGEDHPLLPREDSVGRDMPSEENQRDPSSEPRPSPPAVICPKRLKVRSRD